MEKPVIFEIFTDMDEENDALRQIRNIRVDGVSALKMKIKSILRK